MPTITKHLRKTRQPPLSWVEKVLSQRNTPDSDAEVMLTTEDVWNIVDTIRFITPKEMLKQYKKTTIIRHSNKIHQPPQSHVEEILGRRFTPDTDVEVIQTEADNYDCMKGHRHTCYRSANRPEILGKKFRR